MNHFRDSGFGFGGNLSKFKKLVKTSKFFICKKTRRLFLNFQIFFLHDFIADKP